MYGGIKKILQINTSRDKKILGHSRVPQASVSKRGTKCEVVDMKRIFDSHANTTHLHKRGLALSLVLKVRGFWNSEMAWWIKME